MPIPSLVAICISALAANPDALNVLHALPFRLAHRPPNLIADVVPDPAAVDPRLWAVLVQLYPSLPPFFDAYALPLADPDLPLLQSIPASPLFSLVTLLNLSSCQHLTDQTIFRLKFLHALTALDASNTPITTYAMKSLASTLQLNEDEDSPRKHRGPWELRVLSLRNCKHISNDVYSELIKFPLLSVVDLRGTLCSRNVASPFTPSMHCELYHPATLRESLQVLQSIQSELSASPAPYILTIDKLDHPKAKGTPPQGHIGIQDSFVVFPSNPMGKINVGNTYVLERQIQEREERIRHEKNKDAWYERKERLEELESNGYEDKTNVLRKQVKRDLAGLKPLQNASTRLSNNSTSCLRLPSTSASESSHSPMPLPMARTDNDVSMGSSSSLFVNRSHPHLDHPHPRPQSLQQQPLHLHHSSSSVSSVTSQRLPMKHLPTTAASNSMPRDAHTSGNTNATANRSRHTHGTVIRSEHTITDGTGNMAETAMPDTSISMSSPRDHSPSLPLLPVPAPTTTPHARTNTLTLPPAQFYGSRAARRTAPAPKPAFNSADAHLMLQRDPPAYRVLVEALAQEKDRRAQSGTGPVNFLNGAAAPNRQGKWALNAKEAMEAAVKNRMGGGKEMKRISELPAVSFAHLTKRMASFTTTSLSSSIATSSSSATLDPALSTQAQSRNPFRRRVLSYPNMPEFGGGADVQARARASSSSLASFISSPAKVAVKPSKDSSKDRKTPGKDKPNSKVSTIMPPLPPPRTSCVPTTSSAPPTPNASGKQRMNPAATPIRNPKPLIPISAVKIPILPDDMRKEALRRDAEYADAIASRKRNREAEETDDEAPGFSAKKAVMSSMGKTKAKGKEKKKMKAFDWTNWGKKDAPS